MPSEESLLDASRRAHGLWSDLARVYDDLAAGLGGASADLDGKAVRMTALEAELAALACRLGAARSEMTAPDDPAVAEVWRDIDAILARVRARQPELLRAVTSARDMVATRLARARAARVQAARYGDTGKQPPRITSGRA
jgi:hypothetical protein